MQSDIDFHAVAQAALSATLPRVDDSRLYNYPLSMIGSSSGSDDLVDIKPNINELAGFSGASSSTGGLRFSTNSQLTAVDTRSPATMASTSLPHSFSPFQQPVESKAGYTQDPLKGLSGMASAIVNQFIQQCDFSQTTSNSGMVQPHSSVQSVSLPVASNRQVPSVPTLPRVQNRAMPPVTSSVYHPISYSNQFVESTTADRVHQNDPLPRYTDIGQGYTSGALVGQKISIAVERRNSPIPSVLHASSPSIESTVQRQSVVPPAALSSSSVDINLIADNELEASRVPMTLQLISDLRHSSARFGNGNNERLRRLADELLQQTPSVAGLEGNTSLEEAVRWAVGLACRVCDQALFLLVEWARQAHFFRHLAVSYYMLID